jgi:hypothetical protein
MTSRRFVAAFLWTLIVLVSGSLLFAQSTATAGNITGTVLDPSGAAVAGAAVTATNTGTGASRSGTTDNQGVFSFPDMPIGNYTVSVSKAGFKQFQSRNVQVNVSSVTNVPARLEIGQATESVTVEATAIQVQTTSSEMGEVVSGEQASELPLNGSNFVQLTQIEPGVSHVNNFSTVNKGLIGGVDFSVNGNPVTNNLFLIDGAPNNDVGSNRTILTYPSVDAISEFRMLRNSYGPEYGQASGAVISIVTKGGTNDFHGSVNYYGRNDALSAEDYFAKRHNNAITAQGGTLPHNGKDELRRNDLIYSIGGPIVKNKLFFFWSNEYNREIQGYTRSSCVPTAAEASGDFSGTLSCGAARPVIPAANQAAGNPFKIANPSPAGLLIAQLLPTPNVVPSVATGGNNWFLSTPSPLNFDEENARVDFNVTSRELLTFRYTQDHWTNKAPSLGPNGYLWGEDPFPAVEGNWSQPSKSAIAKLTSSLTDTLVNEVQFSYAGNAIVTTAGGSNPGLASKLNSAIPNVFPTNQKLGGGIPTIWGGLGAYGSGQSLWSIAPYSNNMDLYTVRDDISKVHGNHAFKAGVYMSWNSKNEDQFGGQDRQAFLDPDASWGQSIVTGNTLADLLVPGQVFDGVAEQAFNPVDQARWRDYEFYLADTWKARPNLTLNYGFRWSFYREPYDATNAVGIFDPSTYSAATAMVNGPGGTKQPNVCDGLVVVPGTSFCQAAAQATGIAYTNGTPSPYGRALSPNNNHDIAPRLGIAWDPWGDGKTAIRAGLGQFYQRERVSLNVGISNSAPFVLTSTSNRTLDAAPPASAVTFGGSAANSKVPTTNTPNSWQWNLAVERELYRDTALELAYVGNKGIHLTSIYDINTVAPGPNRVASAFTNGTISNSLRPYPTIGSIFTGDRTGWSTYHGLQVLFRTKVPNVLNLQTAYTWSHSITNIDLGASNGLGSNASNLTDPFNPNLDKGNSTLNRPNMFVTSAIFYLPRLTNRNAFARQTLGGWELSTITTLEDGNSVTVYASNTSGGVGNLFGTGFNGNARPLINPGVSCSQRNGVQVINPAAFTLNGFTVGTENNPLLEPRGYCHAPGLQTVDLALYKNFNVTERVKVQFRIDAFNALNHVNFRGDQINFDWASGGTLNCAGGCGTGAGQTTKITSSTPNQSFGQATGDVGPRQFQYGLRITF